MNWLREADTEPIPGYRLVGPLGTGGFGEVWRCIAPGGIQKAIKFVYGNLNSLDGDAAKAEQEFKALERVKAVRHPFVLSMDRIEVVSGELLIVMELADKSLHDVFEELFQNGQTGIPRESLLGYMSDAAEGLDHLIDKHGLQHLDVKPKNLFLIADRVKVADFGLVKHLERTSSSGIMGGITPVYAAPETFANKISKHSDQYSLAVVYTELLSGRRPFAGKNIRQLALQHMTELPDLSMLPESDRPVVARALAKDPEQRFPNCVSFVRALGGVSSRDGIVQGLSSSQIDHPSSVRQRPATTPEFNLGVTHPSLNLPPRKTPPPVTGKTVTRYPEKPQSAEQSGTISVSIRAEEGILRPAVLIGIGSFGRRALQQIRCRLLDRVGELGQVPCWRYLYIDADPHTAQKIAAGPADAGLLPEHTFHTPLQPVTAYRRRQLDQLVEWLPREKLYSIPRSLKVDTSRALGRLAFSDHYLRFMTRLRHELQVASHPEAVTQSSDHTGLPVRTKIPSVYVFASASGGTSGMLLDVGHAVKRALDRLNIPEAPVTAYVFSGAPNDSTSFPEELANIFATLTELNHYADPDVTFSAQYGGPEGPQIEVNGLPFTATYLLPMAERTPDALQDCIAHLAGYVSHDMTTPLGYVLEKQRSKPVPAGRTPFRSFGTFGVWFPRGLLLRSAARQLCIRFLRQWAAPVNNRVLTEEADQILQMILTDHRLTPDEVQHFIASESGHGAEGNAMESVTTWMAELNSGADAAARRQDPASWALENWDFARDMLALEPTTEADSGFRRGRLSRALDAGIKQAGEAWQNEMVELLRPLDEISGPRLASAEIVTSELVTAAATAAIALEKKLLTLRDQRQRARAELQYALDICSNMETNTGFTIFGSRVARQLRNVADRLRTFAELRIKEDHATAAMQFYRRLQSWFEERLRDLAFARERVCHLAGCLETHLLLPGTDHGQDSGRHEVDSDEAMQTTLRGSNTIRVVLPNGEDYLDQSAADMLERMPVAEQIRLELILTRLVIEPRGGLASVCRSVAELDRGLGAPMVEQSTAFLSNLLPTEDVTAVEFSTMVSSEELTRRITNYVKAAAPLASGPAEEERTFVMVPDSDAGRRYAAEVKKAVHGIASVPVRGVSADLLFCREQGSLRTADLYRLLEPCWEAYHDSLANIDRNPHCRFDVTGWMPLVE